MRYHEMGFARKSQTVIFMDGGQIVEQNEPEGFFNNLKRPDAIVLSQILQH